MKKDFFYIVTPIILLLTCCSSENSDWKKAKEQNKIQVYEQFIKKHPQSAFKDSANNEISKIELIKKCPFSLIKGKGIGLRFGNSLTTEFKDGKIVSLKSDTWMIQGIAGELLKVEQKQSGNSFSGNYSITMIWIDQHFTISNNGKVVTSNITTDEYNKILMQ